jgi:NADPH:quinone reductase-like Zn-dependent oxidoreductase
MAGRVEAVGAKVQQFKPGDDVVGDGGYGGYAEYASVDEKKFVLKPAGLTFEEAAAMPMAALTALQGLRDKGHIQAGQKVLINGASGGVGTFAVQIAKSYGTEVTGVCRTSKMDLVRSIGADHVIDYTREDVTKVEQRFDLIFDVAAFRSVSKYRRILSPKGIYVLAGGSMARIFQSMLMSMTGAKNMKFIGAKVKQEDLLSILELMKAGKVRSIVDKRFPLAGRPRLPVFVDGCTGKIIIKVQ